MKIAIKKLDAIRRELKFEIPKERVSKKFDKIYGELGKAVKVKGFRPGNIPRHILESQHSKLAQEEVIKELVPEAYQEGIQKENINPVDLPEIVDVNLKEGIMTFTAKLDIKPEIKVSDYKKIKVNRKSSIVTAQELDQTLESFKRHHSEGKEVTLDDAFARGLGFPSLEEFKKALSRQLELDKDRHNRVDIEEQVVAYLLKNTKVIAPPSLVKRQLARRLEELKQRLSSQGLSQDEINKKLAEIRQQLEESVERDIRAYLVLDRIAQLENIVAGENENLPAKVMEFLLKEAAWEEAK